jgi:hypothetical protein
MHQCMTACAALPARLRLACVVEVKWAMELSTAPSRRKSCRLRLACVVEVEWAMELPTAPSCRKSCSGGGGWKKNAGY